MGVKEERKSYNLPRRVTRLKLSSVISGFNGGHLVMYVVKLCTLDFYSFTWTKPFFSAADRNEVAG